MADSRFEPVPGPVGGEPRRDAAGRMPGPLTLLFRPTRFFRGFAERRLPLVTVVATYALGIAGTIDRLDQQALREELGAGSPIWQQVADDWRIYWLVCLAVGAIAGAFYYLLGGFWYRKRLEWSGAVDPDRSLARRVYVVAALAYTVPMLLYTSWETSAYSSPRSAFQGEDPWALLVLVFLFWSIVVSYRGVRVLFPLRAWAARVWFLLLPCAVYSIVLIGIAVAFVVGQGWLEQTPRIDEPAQYDNPALTLRYPGNWQIDRSAESEGELSIQPFLEDAAVHLFFYDFPLHTAEAAEATRESLRASFSVVASRPIDRWGRFEGRGFELELRSGEESYRARTFSVSQGSVSFEVIEICDGEAGARLEPGFTLIRESFVFRAKKVVALLEGD